MTTVFAESWKGSARHIAWVVGVALASVAGCGSSAPKPSAPQVEKAEVTALEKRIAELEDQVKGLSGDEGKSNRRDRVQRKLERIDAQLAALEAKVEEVEAKATAAARRPPPPPPPRRNRPDPAATYAVPLNDAPIVGPKHAWVTIVVGWDFGPFVKKVQPTLDQLRKDYGNDVRLAYKTFSIWPARTGQALRATCAAHRQGKFKEMYDAVYAKAYDNGRDFGEDNLIRIADSIGLRKRKFKRDMNSERCRDWVATHKRDLERVGATGTPGFFINGRFLSGARPIDQFVPVIDEELAKAKASGVSKRRYYRRLVKKGIKKLEAN